MKKVIIDKFLNNENYIENEEELINEEKIPFRIVGNIEKKGEFFGFFNYRYLELDLIKGLIKRFTNFNDYPKKPLETIPIINLNSIKKLKKEQNFYPFEIIINDEEKTKKEIYRLKHSISRDKWLEYLAIIFNHLKKDEPMKKIDNQKILFVDDHVGTSQEVSNEKKEKEKITFSNFEIEEILGIGGFGSVYKVKNILNEKEYAMKVMNKNSIIEQKYFHYIMSEFEILKSLSGCPFILDLYYCFQSANYLYMVIDLCTNGDMISAVKINNKKLFICELILAIEYIHKKKIIYRDLKPENILIDNNGHIKLCDFNLAIKMEKGKKRANSFCGSPLYLSPEMAEKKNGISYKADIYQIGLIIYELYTGECAFNGNELEEVYEKIKNNKINFNHKNIIEVEYLKDLLMNILIDEDKRYYFDEIKKHDFFKEINWDDVYNKKAGEIQIKKSNKPHIFTIINKETLYQGRNIDELENDIDKDKNYTIELGKTTRNEIIKDQKKAMKNYVRKFYYVKPELMNESEEYNIIINEEISKFFY